MEPGRYAGIYEEEEEGPPPGVFAVRNLFVDGIDRAAAETIIEQVNASTAAMAVTQIRVLGGAISRVPEEATAYAHRQRPIMLNVASMFQQPDEAEAHESWVDGLATALGDNGEAYVNFIGDEGQERVRQAYPGQTWDRLREVKHRYDPTNLFRLNQNIPPANSDSISAGDGQLMMGPKGIGDGILRCHLLTGSTGFREGGLIGLCRHPGRVEQLRDQGPSDQSDS